MAGALAFPTSALVDTLRRFLLCGILLWGRPSRLLSWCRGARRWLRRLVALDTPPHQAAWSHRLHRNSSWRLRRHWGHSAPGRWYQMLWPGRSHPRRYAGLVLIRVVRRVAYIMFPITVCAVPRAHADDLTVS